jgi:hypothetical protein
MKQINRIISASILFTLVFSLPVPVHAATPSPNPSGGAGIQIISDYCDSAGSYAGDCKSCTAQGKAYTAIGCIDTNNPGVFVGKLLGVGVGTAGGIAFLLIMIGGFQIMTAAGNPEVMNAGKELVSSAITGLILIIFSVFLLRIMGYNILGIPGFG